MPQPDARIALRSRGGFALAVTILVIASVVVLATGAIVIGMNGQLMLRSFQQEDELGNVADAALEEARARINADPSVYPDSGYNTIENNEQAVRADGSEIPGVFRSIFVGPTGVTTGQYGVHGTIVARVVSGPDTVIRRGQIMQESFAKFAYFTDVEPANIAFGGGDQIYGPVHSNDILKIYNSGATFFGPVTTAKTITDEQYASFRQGYTEQVSRIPLPVVADLQKLQVQGSAGGTSFVGSGGSAQGTATTRIEFVAIDLNNDGDVTDDNEGFARVYQSGTASWVVGANPVDDLRSSNNCGHTHSGNVFVSAAAHPTNGVDNYMAALSNATRRCYLGGAPELTNGFVASDGRGSWLQWTGSVSPLLAARADRAYLFPLSRALNPGFKGVIYVNGDVAVSGSVRARVTVAATGNIVIADDVTYTIDPSVGSCADILGLFAGGDIVVANTPINAPWRRNTNSNAYFSYDDSNSEFIHAFVLTLGLFTVQNYDTGSERDESCEQQQWGRGCLYLTGGIIQRQRGAVGTAAGTGYLKRYSYDACGLTQPPPYFPTTGRFSRSAFYEVDPVGFDVDAYYRLLTAGR
jgi:hypothetical protein